MTIKFIYHNKESMAGGVSPFDSAIIETVKNKEVKIICPYIGLNYLKRIIQSAISWCLITDIEELVLSQERNSREEIMNFINNNLSNIRHYKNIHAKAIIVCDKVFFGSANLTEKGITRRIELSALIYENNKINELNQWYDALWIDSDLIDNNSLKQLMIISKYLPDLSENKPKSLIFSKSPSNNSKLFQFENDMAMELINRNTEDYEKLKKVIRKYPSKDWINSYFDLAKQIIDLTNLGHDDKRLVMSIQNNSLPITINQRYILRAKPSGELGLILPLEYDSSNYERDKVLYEDKKYFYRNKVHEARWVVYDKRDKIEFFSGIKQYWKQAVIKEINRGRKSSFRKYHKIVFYNAVINLTYRKILLEQAFSEKK